MPGSPPTTPNVGIPRYADTDTASFSAQLNGVSDVVDAAPHIHQPGDLIHSAASTRAGALLCDGTAYSRTTYAALFAAIGTTYGAGDGSTTFNVPDLRGRVIVAAGAGAGLTTRSRGQTFGTENETAPLPVHNHPISISDPGHSHQTNLSPLNTMQPGSNAGDYWNFNASSNLTTTNTTGITASSSNAGAGGTHNNVQPAGVVNIFIKT